jgi:hypothetical protein
VTPFPTADALRHRAGPSSLARSSTPVVTAAVVVAAGRWWQSQGPYGWREAAAAGVSLFRAGGGGDSEELRLGFLVSRCGDDDELR